MPQSFDPNSPVGVSISLVPDDVKRLRKGAPDNFVADKAYNLDPQFRSLADHYFKPEINSQLDEEGRKNLPTMLLNMHYFGRPLLSEPDDVSAELAKPSQGLFSKIWDYASAPFDAATGVGVMGLGRATGVDVSRDPHVKGLAENAQQTADISPLVGSVIGSAVGPVGTAAGAIAGKGIGNLIETGIDVAQGKEQRNTISQKLYEPVVEGAIAGTVDYGVGKALKLAKPTVKKLLSPFASRFDGEIAALAAKNEIELPVSSLSKSNAVRQLETVAQKGFAGGIAEKQVDIANKQLSIMADDLVKGFKGSDDFTIAGKSVIEGADAFRDSWRAAKNKAYASAKELLKNADTGAFQPSTSATVNTIDEILSGKQAASQIMGDAPVSDTVTSILTTIRQNLTSGKPLSLEAYTSTLDELNQLTKFGNSLVSTGDQGVLKKVIATMDQDVTRGLEAIAPNAAKALKKADNLYAKGIQILDSDFGSKIAKLSDNPTKIVDQLITPKSADDVPRIFELIGKGKNGPQRVADVQSAFTRKILDSSTGQKGLLGNQIDKSIDRYGETTIKSVLGEDAFQGLREIQKIATALNRGQSVAEGSQTAYLTKITAFITALATGNLPAAAGIAGGDVALSKLFSTQWFRTWLTKGFETSPVIENVAKKVEPVLRKGAVLGAQAFTQ